MRISTRPSVAASVVTPKVVAPGPKLEKAARDYMKKAGLIRPGEESRLVAMGLDTAWRLEKTVPYGDATLLVMKLTTTTNGQRQFDAGDCLEVVALKKGKLVSFESLGPLPKRIVVQTETGFVVELKGDSVVAARKALAVQETTAGLNAAVIPGGRAPFDPKKDRTWRVVDATFDLRRGSTGEEMDIQSWDFDRHFQDTFQGANIVSTPFGPGAQIAPWHGGVVKELKVPATR